MDHALVVRLLERGQDLSAEMDDARGAERPLVVDELLQRAAVEQLHREIVEAVVFAEVEHAEEVGMREQGGRVRLDGEAARHRWIGEPVAVE
jgi:hypothetical protein